MLRSTWKPALALGAVLATCGAAGAADRDTQLLFGTSSSTTMTLGGQGTVAQAATEDLELTGRGWGGWGWRGGWGWSTGWNRVGWGWGGDWSSLKDYQHVSANGR